MGSEWREARLGQLGEVNRGRSRHRPRDAAHLYGGAYPFIQTGDIKASGGRITSHSQTYSEAGLAQSRLWPEGTMVITIAANIAETAILTYPACFPDSVVGFVADKRRADVRFVEYLFRRLRRQIQHENVGTGSVQDNINLQTLARLTLRVPEPHEQRRIAHILGTLDDKIENNRKMAKTLEATAQAIFQSWFVDFDPVRAKMEGRWQRGRSLPGLPARLYDIFPDRIDDDGKPEGWVYRPVGDFAVLKGGKQLEKEKISSVGQIPVFGGAGIMGYTDRYNADGFVIAVGRVGAYCGQFFTHLGKAWINNNASLVRQTNNELGDWLLHSLRHAEIDVIKKGAAQPFVSNGDIENLPLIWPGDGLVRAFTDVVGPFHEMQDHCDTESRTIAQIRDTLLPKLISGEIRVPESNLLDHDAMEKVP